MSFGDAHSEKTSAARVSPNLCESRVDFSKIQATSSQDWEHLELWAMESEVSGKKGRSFQVQVV